MKNSVNPNSLAILVDHREAQSRLFKLMVNSPNVEVKVGHLDVGDYLIENTLIVERKTILDLICSIKDGRLFFQAGRLASHHLPALIILEGPLSSSTKINREAVQGALTCLSFQYGLPLLRSFGPDESLKIVIQTYRQITSDRVYKTPWIHRNKPKSKIEKDLKRQIFILQGLPGIGPHRAKALLEKFKSVRSVFSADKTQLKEVRGIDEKLAEKIFWLVNKAAF